jgi:hypothetical protein
MLFCRAEEGRVIKSHLQDHGWKIKEKYFSQITEGLVT